MKIGIMQPYFFPYIGYWQLMNAVDKYVVYDDVNYIKRGWINRNRILVNGEAKYINLPVLGASQNKRINQVNINLDIKLLSKNLRILENAYRKAPYFADSFKILDEIFIIDKDTVSEYIYKSFEILCRYFGIKTELILSSQINKNNELRGQEKILEICRKIGADEYYNAIGGTGLYSKERFTENGIKLHFLKTDEIVYPQFKNEFVPNLSIIDVMMFNSKEQIKDMLGKFTLV